MKREPQLDPNSWIGRYIEVSRILRSESVSAEFKRFVRVAGYEELIQQARRAVGKGR